MAYSDFTLKKVVEKFSLEQSKTNIFNNLTNVNPSERLQQDLEEASAFHLNTEKSKSEWIVVPILKEVYRNNDKVFTIYSGEQLNIDKENGLVGECDYIFSLVIDSILVKAPVFQLVEAKKGDVDLGIGQCIAQMLGAQIFNKRKGKEVDIYGCVTSGKEWLFLKLIEKQIFVNNKTYFLNEIEKILGIFQHIINEFKKEEVLN